MAEAIFKQYLANLQATLNQGDAREESFYEHIKTLLLQYVQITNKKKPDITILPKATEAGNPDFRVWDGKNHITGYIEAKAPSVFNLDQIETSDQLKRYLKVFPNLILTNFYEFRLYQHGLMICTAIIGRASNAFALHKAPPLEQAEQFSYLLERYFAFSLPAIDNPKALAKELAKRTRFLRDEIIAIELAEEERHGKKVLLGFYDSFKRLLINKLTHEQFADLYAQTLTYGIFAARTKSEGDFNRELIYKYIPNTLGVLKSIFKFISYDEPPKALEVLIDDIAEILCVTDIKKILHVYYKEGKGSDPIIHFYETFLSEYDPNLREKRGVYYTPEPVVRYIVKSIHNILKSHFNLKDGLADSAVTLLDPAAGTLTFPAEAIKLAVQEYTSKYGSGSIKQMIKNHILPHFYALELMMAPYTVGHLKISYLLDELGYQLADDERFKLYLTNTLEKDLPAQIETPFTHEI
ncbi:MAG: N-6 DNA methylase, partial [Candidatus Cloacimonas sp.]|nr:N-6 DNA methylase [Candidatus Cloacimonas sp.]